MANYVPSGWKRDLTHFIGCCWEAQIGSLEWDEWRVAITKFLGVMVKKKNHEWMDIKELTPYMGPTWQNYLERSPDKTSQASTTLPDGLA